MVELYGILGPDWQTVKKAGHIISRCHFSLNEAWLMRDLQALMESPSRWWPTDIGCKDFLGALGQENKPLKLHMAHT